MKPLRILSISDIHFGNTHIDPFQLADNFRRYVIAQLDSIDLLLVGGDFFDTALALSDIITPSILTIMYDLLATANKYNVTVRFVRGTFSHERTQCQYFQLLHSQQNYTNDLKYFDTITLDYLEQFDLRILFLPDDLPYTNSAAIIAVVNQKLRELNWDYVDYAVVHGYFDHVVPVGAHQPKNTYLRSQFDFVTRYVLIGHVHTSTIVDKFIYNGSFDRLAHGEEEPKGFIRIDDDGIVAHVKFITNNNATKFITLDYSTITDEVNVMQKLTTVIEQLTPKQTSHIRLIHPNISFRHGVLKFVHQTYPHIHISLKAPNTKDAAIIDATSKVIDFLTLVKPTEHLLPTLILDHGEIASKPLSVTEERIRLLLQLDQLE